MNLPTHCANCRSLLTPAELHSVKYGPSIQLEAVLHWGTMHCNHCCTAAAEAHDFGDDDLPVA